MDESFAPEDLLSQGELRALSQRRDGPGLLRLVAQLTALVGTGVLAFGGGAWAWAGLVLHGLVQGTVFAMAHETLHGTAFRSRWLNRAACALGCFIILMPPTGFRAFHFAHHRFTHQPGKDPELAVAGAEAWPKNPLLWVALLSGQGVLLARLLGLIVFAAGAPKGLCERLFPYVRAEERARVVAQARVIVALHGAIVALGLFWIPGLLWWPLTWVFGHLLQGPWLTAEHTGLPVVGSIFDRTRTVRLGDFARFWCWNMSFHAEHHAWPSVPFWRLPELHARVEGGLVHVERGYLGVYAGALFGGD